MPTRMLAVAWRMALALFTDPLATLCLVTVWIAVAVVGGIAWHLLMRAVTLAGRRGAPAAEPEQVAVHDHNPDRREALDDLLVCQRIFHHDHCETTPTRTRLLRRRNRTSRTARTDPESDLPSAGGPPMPVTTPTAPPIATSTRRPTCTAVRNLPVPRRDNHDGPVAGDGESEQMVLLVHRAQEGSAEAFGELYRIYLDTVFRYIYHRVSTRALAEDLAGETFLRALRRITTFSWQGRDFGAWLVTIARNLVADHFKSSRHRMEITTGEMLDAGEVERSPEDSVLERLSNEVLLDAVGRLNDHQRECITLRFLQGLSVAETAEVMGKNGPTIKALQYRAVRTLARLLPADARLAGQS